MESLLYADAERLFFNSIKSKHTRRAYVFYIQRYVRFVGCKTINDLVSQFNDAKEIERRIIDFITQMK